MGNIVTRMSPVAVAVALSLGAGVAFAQDDSTAEARAAIEQHAEQASQSLEQGADRGEPGSLPASDRANQRADDRADDRGMAIDQLAHRHAELSTFVEAIKTSGLEDSLTDGTEYTVFAPTNEAFDGQDVESLLEPEHRDQLIAMLRAHIVADDLDRELAGTIGQAKTIDGGTIDVSVDGDTLRIGDVETSLNDGIQLGHLRVYAVDGVLESKAMPDQNPQAALRPAR